ncbi:MAG: hypothetical protein A2Z88_08295 [Omnitrophica WOR_2 bacterium GWA2_47_8]|nr:MAG: hypothetical protein A2Z88_08295 [Omnitrophica WOR_2 bacterium GWA2_47_8]
MNTEANISRADFLKKIPFMLFRKIKPHWEESAAPQQSMGALIARVDISRCLAWGQMECQLCYLACPLRDKAIEMREHKPFIIAAGCDGCGMCVDACKTINNTPALDRVPSSGLERGK